MADNLARLSCTDRWSYYGPYFEYKGYQHFIHEELGEEGFWYLVNYAVGPTGDQHIVPTQYQKDNLTFENFQKRVDAITRSKVKPCQTTLSFMG